MIDRINLILIVSFLSLGMISCSSGSGESTGENHIGDSLEIEIIEDDFTNQPDPVSPELIGKWKLIETRMGGENIPSMGESTLTFTQNHELISTSDDFPAETFEFFEENGEINSDLWDSSQKITNLGQSELILSETISGEEVHYVYKRIM